MNLTKPALGSALLLSLGFGTAALPLASELRGMVKESFAKRQMWANNQRQKLSVKYHSIRLTQARELMGLDYKKSIVKKGEQITEVNSFVFEKVRLMMKQSPAVADLVAETIITESRAHKFDPIFLMSVISNESGFNTLARGSHGEIGLMQLKPSTASWIASRAGIKWDGSQSLVNPVVNIRLGAAYLAQLRAKFGSSQNHFLAAYNMGTTKLNRALKSDIKPRAYVSRVLAHYQNLYTELMARKTGSKAYASLSETSYQVADDFRQKLNGAN